MATAPVTAPPLSLGAVRTFRHTLDDGAATTVHAAVYERSRVALRVVALEAPEPLAGWCARSGVQDALVGGFFVTPVGTPLGELWIGGARRATVPFDAPWGPGRSCLAVDDEGRIELDGRHGLPAEPPGDLLQAGPLLVRSGRPAVRDGDDPEGFSAGRAQFDSDIADGRHPRAALGVSGSSLIAVVCDGRAEDEAGLSLGELACLMVELGAAGALNLDGGGSAALVADGRLRNVPREAWGREIPGGRPIATALAIRPRAGAQDPRAASS
jgi:hypothetical protein